MSYNIVIINTATKFVYYNAVTNENVCLSGIGFTSLIGTITVWNNGEVQHHTEFPDTFYSKDTNLDQARADAIKWITALRWIDIKKTVSYLTKKE